MDIEKNIIFFHPLNPILEKLKSELETDEAFTIFEMDTLAEYGQVIGIFEKSISYCSDLKNIAEITKQFKQFVNTKDARLILINQRTIPPHILGMHKNNGLDKVYKANVQLDELMVDIDTFYTQSDDAEVIEDNSDFVIYNKSKTKNDGPENLRIRSMAILEEKISDVRVKNMFLTQGLNVFEDLKMSESKQKLNLQEFSPKLKKINFKPFESAQKKRTNTFQEKDLGGMIGSRSKLHDFAGVQKERERKNFRDELGGNYKKKEVAKFEEVDKEVQKRKKFEQVDPDRERKKAKEKEEQDYNKKRKKFEEVEREKEQKPRIELEEQEYNKKKHAKFEEVARDRDKKKESQKEDSNANKKRKHFEEVAIEREAKKNNNDEEDAKDKERKKFEEVEQEKNKKKNNFEEVQREYEHKKLRDDQEHEAQKKKQFVEVEIEREKAQKKELAQKERKKAQGINIEELDRDSDDKLRREEEEEKEKKKKHFEEVLKAKEAKKSNFQEKTISTHWGGTLSQSPTQDKKKIIRSQRSEEDDDKNKDIVVLDYRKFKKQYLEGKLTEEEISESEIKNEFATNVLKQNETFLYRASEMPLKNLLDFLEFYLLFKHPPEMIIKFMHMVVFKEINGSLKVFDEMNKPIYPLDYEINESDLIILGKDQPFYFDEKLIEAENYFYMPIALDGKVLAKIIIEFKSSDVSLEKLGLLDSFCFMLRGVFL